MRYVVDLRHPLQAPCGGDDSSFVQEGISNRRGRGNVGIPQGFPRSVGRVGSRLHGFPCFPYSVISMACFWGGDQEFVFAEILVLRQLRTLASVRIQIVEIAIDADVEIS